MSRRLFDGPRCVAVWSLERLQSRPCFMAAASANKSQIAKCDHKQTESIIICSGAKLLPRFDFSCIADGIQDFQTAQQLGSKLFKLIHKYLRKYLLRIWNLAPNKKAEIYSLSLEQFGEMWRFNHNSLKSDQRRAPINRSSAAFMQISLSYLSPSVRDKIHSLLSHYCGGWRPQSKETHKVSAKVLVNFTIDQTRARETLTKGCEY